jgi:hypothetical protein
MAKVNQKIWVCSDCLMAIANGDFSGLDNDPETADRRQAEIEKGIESFEGYLVVGDDDIEFSHDGCECCGSPLAGSLYEVIELVDEDEDEDEDDEFSEIRKILINDGDIDKDTNFDEWMSDHFAGEADTLEDWVEEFLDSASELSRIPERLRNYFDYKAYARDMELGGDIFTIRIEGDSLYVFWS